MSTLTMSTLTMSTLTMSTLTGILVTSVVILLVLSKICVPIDARARQIARIIVIIIGILSLLKCLAAF